MIYVSYQKEVDKYAVKFEGKTELFSDGQGCTNHIAECLGKMKEGAGEPEQQPEGSSAQEENADSQGADQEDQGSSNGAES